MIRSTFISVYDPTIEESYRKHATIDSEACLLDILDTAGQEEYSTMRDQYFRMGQGFVLIYSITSKQSFEDLNSLYREQILRVRDSERFPMVLCGNKCDLEGERQVSKEDAEKAAKGWEMPFFECSALTRLHVEDTFYTLVREIRKDLKSQPQKNLKRPPHKCTLL
uniref:Uncharacterized protein n=1 Tax=Arcella intermedia TaxID=1963864 RepID=A0A6B2LK46_9EUKA